MNHPHDRAERLTLKRKYSLKHSRPPKGLRDETDQTAEDRRINETTTEEGVGIPPRDDQP